MGKDTIPASRRDLLRDFLVNGCANRKVEIIVSTTADTGDVIMTVHPAIVFARSVTHLDLPDESLLLQDAEIVIHGSKTDVR
jgi:hypothetical protein